jgi:HD-like signal output (HDOD) protein
MARDSPTDRRDAIPTTRKSGTHSSHRAAIKSAALGPIDDGVSLPHRGKPTVPLASSSRVLPLARAGADAVGRPPAGEPGVKLSSDVLQRLDAMTFPTPPTAVVRLAQLLAKDGVTGDEIAEVLALDATLAVRVLRLANSIALGGASDVNSVREAVLRVGVETVRDVVFAVSMVSALRPTGFDYRPFWRHSLAVATTARILQERSRRTGAPCPEAYAAGLLHDLGMLALDRALGSHYRRLRDAAEKSGRALFEVEQEALGTDHAQLGGRMLEVWQFPKRLIDATRLHHRPGASDSSVTLVVHLADFVCNQAGIHHGTRFHPTTGPDRTWLEFGLTKADLPAIVARMRSELARAEAIVAAA